MTSGFSQICKRCVMDTSDGSIFFDENGFCNHCNDYIGKAEKALEYSDLELTIQEIKSKKKGKYDCIVGLSGGVDSSYVALQAKKLGLSPLVVHFDNGWNSELAVKNIQNIVTTLDFDLYTLVVDWEEFKSLQLAYLRASVVDIEVPTDHAITGTIYRLASKYGIKYILSGSNIATESIMPDSWIYSKNDAINLKAINDSFGSIKLRTYPVFNFLDYTLATGLKGIKSVNILNYIPYNKDEAKKILTDELGWRDYGGKHYESIFTKFYQAYILPSKFNIDKRRAHLSSLICSGQITRQEALKELERPLYSEQELAADKEYVLKKLGLSEEEFENIMNLPVRSHNEFATDRNLKEGYMELLRKTSRFRKLLKFSR
ncbi:N-acetyl sugar amidotransferase [Pontibacter cellulosilyticus]|uniref:N-acetyl sugar amidotransferase n=1 Tax=Pontibacter cellulosilyticus TaxID=1720253 RepID=A0A923N4K3_9BACT|nr:N-acetyl sugar amidotransferase [Pontibacter cellulosilyticus]MBC5991617.1 N-acetyl sugar amidotransferase [Pontibacter cellulosilyticus]